MKHANEIHQCSILNRKIYINFALEYLMSEIEKSASLGNFEVRIKHTEIDKDKSNSAYGFMEHIITELENNGYTCQSYEDYTDTAQDEMMLYIGWYKYENQNEI